MDGDTSTESAGGGRHEHGVGGGLTARARSRRAPVANAVLDKSNIRESYGRLLVLGEKGERMKGLYVTDVHQNIEKKQTQTRGRRQRKEPAGPVQPSVQLDRSKLL